MTREPEWDDAERNQMLGLVVYENGVCECGFHESLIDPATLHVTFEPKVCPVCAGAAAFGREQKKLDDEQDKMLGKDPAPTAKRAADGRRTFIREMTADEVDKRRAASVGGQLGQHNFGTARIASVRASKAAPPSPSGRPATA